MFCADIIKLIALKDTKRAFRTPGIYLIFLLSAAVIGVSAYFFSAIQKAPGMAGAAGAFPLVSILTAAGICALYMAFSSVSSVARERQEHTLEVLFYGPVDEGSFIAGKYLGRMIPVLFLFAALVLYVLFISAVLGSVPGADIVLYVLFSILFISCVVGLGIMLSNLAGSVTVAVFVLMAFMLGLLFLGIAGSILQIIPAFNPALSIAKDIISALLAATRYISPVEYLGIGLGAASSGDMAGCVLAFLYPVLYTSVVLVLAVLILKKKGVGR